MNKLICSILIYSIANLSVLSCGINEVEIFESNSQKSIGNSVISMNEFFRITSIAEELFVEKAKAHQIDLSLDTYWDKPIVNAHTLVLGSSVTISIYGGLVNLTSLSSRGFAVALCHELGHALGGAPYFGDFNNTVEGGADYYSSNDCLKELLPALQLPTLQNVSEEVSMICSQDKERDTCEGVLTGGLDLMNVLSSLLSNESIALSYKTPDLSVSESTLRSYPSYQCRVDTLLRGYFNISKPACWFNKNDLSNERDNSGVISI